MLINTTDFVKQLQLTTNTILGIDGPCGSGKSTLANQISQMHNADIIHLDDFFLPPELRTPTRLSEIGGNVHYERFHDEVIRGIHSQKPFTYRRFNCHIMNYDKEIVIDNNKPIVIEGSYSLRPDFRSIYTKTIYLDVDASTQKQRLIKRVGVERYSQFESLWIPKEDAYFQTFRIKEIADIVL